MLRVPKESYRRCILNNSNQLFELRSYLKVFISIKKVYFCKDYKIFEVCEYFSILNIPLKLFKIKKNWEENIFEFLYLYLKNPANLKLHVVKYFSKTKLPKMGCGFNRIESSEISLKFRSTLM